MTDASSITGQTNIKKWKTPRPSDWQHSKTLMPRSFAKDKKKPALWAAKFLLSPLLFMLYTIGFFLAASTFIDDGTVNVGDYSLFLGQEWKYPSIVLMSGWNVSFVEAVADTVHGLIRDNHDNDNVNVTALSATSNVTEFTSLCQSAMPSTALEGVCVYFNASNAYTIFYGGTELAAPFQSGLASAQYIINRALVDLELDSVANSDRNNTLTFPVSFVQRTPRLLTAATVDVPVVLLLFPSILFTLSCCIALDFLIGPVVFEKINKVTEAYQMSDAFLIFMSHYLALLQLSSCFVLLMQFETQEESAENKPWIVWLISMVIGALLLVFTDPVSIPLYVFSVFFPFVGIMQYFGLYITFDTVGYGTGIHVGDNVFESGLFGVYMVQLAGLGFYLGLTWLYSSQNFNDWLSNYKDKGEKDITVELASQDRFESLVPGSEVVMSVRGLKHTYTPPHFNYDKDTSPSEVLKGLDLDVCRGEVFGYLGHNGAGKTTSINILTGQLKMQQGTVKYHLRGGEMNLRDPKDEQIIRTSIGVCPQHNTALQNDMTAREYLTLIAHLKGGVTVEPGQSIADSIAAEVEKRLSEIAFTSQEDADKFIDTYSGGMKRKVLIAMALLGDPEVIFLDEPTAGIDPYNRRTIWDMIISAKRGRSIVLCSHFLDEVDVLSDRIGIIKDGVMTTCGSSLFLKHHFGAGYTLTFEAPTSINVSSIIATAKAIQLEETGVFRWRLGHGTETQFPETLDLLVSSGAKNVNLELTTLEQVFLETGKEDSEDPIEQEQEGLDKNVPESWDPETPESHHDVSMIWEPRATKSKIGFWRKLSLVQHFIMLNALKSKGTILLNVTMPLIYLVAGVVLSVVVKSPEAGVLITNDQIPINPFLATSETMNFFGIPTTTTTDEISPILPLLPSVTPTSIEDYFEGFPVLGGYYEDNATLQHAPELSPFALQVGVAVLSNYTSWNLSVSSLDGITTAVQQLPYLSTVPFRIDLLFIPYCLVFGFAGLAFSLLDVLIFKGDNIIEIFRVNGLTEWTTYLGVVVYKLNTTFLPFFILLVVLGFSFSTVIFGNGGRWLGTILTCLTYAFSSSPQGLILAKRFVHSDFKSVASWFPGVYFTFVGLPYILYSVLLQTFPDSEQAILLFGDILTIAPQLAFQRAIGAVLWISTNSQDPELQWNEVWAFENRLWYCLLTMTIVGTVEWWYLYRLTTAREATTKLDRENRCLSEPITVEDNQLVANERDRSLANNEGINARDLVKIFQIRDGKRRKKKKLKKAVKGVSFGVRKNEIFALLGPNGAGKTVTMSMLSSQITPEHGEIALDGVVVGSSDRSTDCLYNRANISFCAQADALFKSLTVEEHCRFYTNVRGLDWDNEITQEHIGAIVKLLGLNKHRHKKAQDLSGGYKRRLCLALSLIGYPNVCLLDEISTGLDPGARRQVWKVLKPTGVDVPPILLSSHYMDECEQLGTRIGIMIDGELVSTGSLNELYEKYCRSFFVEVSFKSDCNDATSEGAVIQAFAEVSMTATVYESLPYHIKFQVKINDKKEGADTQQLAQIFDILETKKFDLNIKFYSVSKMNLEQIFIDLSRQQFQLDEEFNNIGAQESTRHITSVRSQ
ncbi:ABC transporter [Nitzschia inconspicua]|uniref:ABC transporter n=1 Tax=Nitzschia inconspicua TaxID=303405 RepID=A0A9K3LRG7_9STRA|nr:ABC transporter [Nitzschia inconspicua]